jgi:site-specific recombinase XerD
LELQHYQLNRAETISRSVTERTVPISGALQCAMAINWYRLFFNVSDVYLHQVFPPVQTMMREQRTTGAADANPRFSGSMCQAVVACHCLRRIEQHDVAWRIEANYNIRTMQELLDQRDVRTTMVYTHVLNRGGKGVCSPMDSL